MTQYTREQILSMPAGREMDRIVAEKVMNLCVLDRIDGYGDDCVVSDEGWQEWTKHPMCGLTEDPDFLPPYSTDISAAWEVAQKFPSFQVTKMHDVELPWAKEAMYRAIIKGNKYVAHAKTAPIAICRAALLAVMGI